MIFAELPGEEANYNNIEHTMTVPVYRLSYDVILTIAIMLVSLL